MLRSHLPDLGCWNLSSDKEGGGTEDTPAAANNNNNHIIIGDLGNSGNQKDHFGPNLTPLHRFYKQQQQRKMPGFRGRRGLCGCFQVSAIYVCSIYIRSKSPFGLYRFLCQWNRVASSYPQKGVLFILDLVVHTISDFHMAKRKKKQKSEIVHFDMCVFMCSNVYVYQYLLALHWRDSNGGAISLMTDGRYTAG